MTSPHSRGRDGKSSGVTWVALSIGLDEDFWDFVGSFGILLVPFITIALVGAVFYGPPIVAILLVKTLWESIVWAITAGGSIRVTVISVSLLGLMLAAAGLWGPLLVMLFVASLMVSLAQSGSASLTASAAA
jgi:hypothetical protein